VLRPRSELASSSAPSTTHRNTRAAACQNVRPLWKRSADKKRISGAKDFPAEKSTLTQQNLLLLLLLQPFNGLFSRTTWASRYQKGFTSLDRKKYICLIFTNKLYKRGSVDVRRVFQHPCHPPHVRIRQEMTGLWGCSAISWTTCKHSAPRFRQTTTPTAKIGFTFRARASAHRGRWGQLTPWKNG